MTGLSNKHIYPEDDSSQPQTNHEFSKEADNSKTDIWMKYILYNGLFKQNGENC